jgi:hypothetical protein
LKANRERAAMLLGFVEARLTALEVRRVSVALEL